MKYISPYILLKYVDQNASELNSVALGVARRQLQMKFDFDRLDSINVDGVDYTRDDVTKILDTLLYERDIQHHRWVHEIPALRSFLVDNKIQSIHFEIPQEIRFSPHFDSFKKFITPFLLPKVESCYDDLQSSGNYKRATFISHLGPLINGLDYDAYLRPIREHLTILKNAFTTNGDNVAELNELQSEFQQYLSTIPKELKTEKDLLASFVKTSVDGTIEVDDLHITEKAPPPPPPVSRPRTTSETSQSQPKKKPKAQSQPKKTIRDTSKIPPISTKSKPKLGRLFWTIGVLLFFGISLLVRVIDRASDDDYDFNFDDYWDETYDDYEIENEFDEQLSYIQEYVDENKSEGDPAEFGDFVDESEIPSDYSEFAPFEDWFKPLEEQEGYDGWKIKNSTDYAVIMMVDAVSERYSYFIPAHSESKLVFSLYYGDRIVFYAGKAYKDTPDLSADGSKGFEFVTDATERLLGDMYECEDDVEGYEDYTFEDEDGNQLYDYSIHLWKSGKDVRASFVYRRSIPLRPRT